MTTDELVPEKSAAEAMAAEGREFSEWLLNRPDDLARLQKLSAELGLSPLELRPEEGFAKLQFQIEPKYCNFLRQVHGGIIATLLDETVGVCGCGLVGRGFRGTVSSHVDYLEPALPGVLFTEGRLTKKTARLLFFETDLRSASNDLLARGSSVVAYGPIRG